MPAPRRIALMLELNEPFKRHTEIFVGAERFAREHGWECVIDEFADHALPSRRGAESPYDGVIARANKRLARRSRLSRIPVVNVWVNSPVRDLPCVFPDLTMAGTAAAEHLWDRGLRRFACLEVDAEMASMSVECAAFRRVATADGGPCATAYLPHNQTTDYTEWKRWERRLRSWIEEWRPPIGVFIPHDHLARRIVGLAADRGLRVPDDVALVSSQNDEPFCERPPPSLTSVDYDMERVGYEAAELLERLMDGEDPPEKPVLVPSKGLVVRASTDFTITSDPVVAEALRFIADNSRRGVSVGEVASAVNVTPITLQRKFRESVGRSVAAEIRFLRVDRVKRALVQSDRPIKTIALEAGFKNVQRLDEMFRRVTGVSPSAFRNGERGKTRR